MTGLYLILFGQGLLTVLVHCPGMCGPLIVGLRLGSLRDVLAYQGGKAVTYALLGAVAGACGGGLRLVLQRQAGSLIIALGAGLMLAGILGLRRRGVGEGATPSWLVALLRRLAGRGPWFIGLGMAFLPCAVLLWALGLAIASGSAFHGALLMVGLVVMTTPILAVAHVAGRGAWRFARWWWLAPLGLVAAGGWLAWQGINGGSLCASR